MPSIDLSGWSSGLNAAMFVTTFNPLNKEALMDHIPVWRIRLLVHIWAVIRLS
jgi:hypothetical protein